MFSRGPKPNKRLIKLLKTIDSFEYSTTYNHLTKISGTEIIEYDPILSTVSRELVFEILNPYHSHKFPSAKSKYKYEVLDMKY